MRNLFVLYCLLAAIPAQAADLALVHARAYPSPGAAAIEDATILIRGNRIVSLRASAPIPRNATVLDCAGMTVTAGLWNSHVHILPRQFLHADQKTGAQLTAAFQEMLTRWGFTTVFDIASVLANDNNIRARIASAEILGPRIFTTGEPFFPAHAIPVYVKGYLDRNRIVLPDDIDDAAAAARVQEQIRHGADAIKIFAGSVQLNNVVMMPLDRAKVIVAAAHRLHKPVFAHPQTIQGVEIALDSGVDILAHVTADKEPWPASLVQRLLSAHTALIATLMLFDEEAKKADMSPADTQLMIDRAVSKLRAYSAAGGEILFGTDVGYIYNFNPSEEYALMRKAGLTFPRILASLTTNPARRFEAVRSGRIAPNMDADLTVFASDPATDITAFSRVRYTIRAGRIIYQSVP